MSYSFLAAAQTVQVGVPAAGSLNPLQARPTPQQMMQAPTQSIAPAGSVVGGPAPIGGQGVGMLPPPPPLAMQTQEPVASDLSTMTVTAIMDGAAALRTSTNAYQVFHKGMLSHGGRLYGVEVKDGTVTLFDRSQNKVFQAAVGSGVSPEQRNSWTRSQSSSGTGSNTGSTAATASSPPAARTP